MRIEANNLRNILKENGISRFPIYRGNILLGYVTDRIEFETSKSYGITLKDAVRFANKQIDKFIEIYKKIYSKEVIKLKVIVRENGNIYNEWLYGLTERVFREIEKEESITDIVDTNYRKMYSIWKDIRNEYGI